MLCPFPFAQQKIIASIPCKGRDTTCSYLFKAARAACAAIIFCKGYAQGKGHKRDTSLVSLQGIKERVRTTFVPIIPYLLLSFFCTLLKFFILKASIIQRPKISKSTSYLFSVFKKITPVIIGLAGFEPAIATLWAPCSNQLNYKPLFLRTKKTVLFFVIHSGKKKP